MLPVLRRVEAGNSRSFPPDLRGPAARMPEPQSASARQREIGKADFIDVLNYVLNRQAAGRQTARRRLGMFGLSH